MVINVASLFLVMLSRINVVTTIVPIKTPVNTNVLI